MDQTTQKISRTIWIGIGLLIVILATSFVLSRLQGQRTAVISVSFHERQHQHG